MIKLPNGFIYERELKRLLEDKGFFVVRSAGSFTVDLVAIKMNRNPIAFEIKSSCNETYYLNTRAKTQIKEMKGLKTFGIEPVFAVRFKRKGSKKKWVFLKLDSVRSKIMYGRDSDFIL